MENNYKWQQIIDSLIKYDCRRYVQLWYGSTRHVQEYNVEHRFH